MTMPNDKSQPEPETVAQQETGGDCVSRLVVPLRDALALVDFGPCKTAERPQDWINVARPMCAHCEGAEDVNLAAARIIAAEYRKALAVIESIEERYIDGCDTYEDWKFMGSAAREYLLPPNETSPSTGANEVKP